MKYSREQFVKSKKRSMLIEQEEPRDDIMEFLTDQEMEEEFGEYEPSEYE